MTFDVLAYLNATYPPPLSEHLSDEDIALQLDKSASRSKAAHKGQERKRQQQAVQQVSQEKI